MGGICLKEENRKAARSRGNGRRCLWVRARITPQAILGAAILVNLLFFVVWHHYYGTVRPFETDAYYCYAYLPSLILDGDLDLENNFSMPSRHNPAAFRREIWGDSRTPTGRLANKYGVGFAVMSVPPFLVGHGLAWLGVRYGHVTSWPLDGYSPPYMFCVAAWQIALSAAGIVCCFLIAKNLASPLIAALASCAGWIGTMLLFYTSHSLFMCHASAFFTVSCFALCATRLAKSESLLLWTSAGMVGGLMASVRYQNAIFLLLGLPATVSLLRSRRGWQRSATKMGLFMLGFFVAAAPQLMVWKRLYGSWIVYTYAGEGFNWLSPNVQRMFLHPRAGLFRTSPMYVLGLLGFVALVINRRGAFLTTAGICLALQVYLNSTWHCWDFGETSFSIRPFADYAFVAVLGLAHLFQHPQRWLRRLSCALAPLLGAWNVGAMIVFVRLGLGGS